MPMDLMLSIWSGSNSSLRISAKSDRIQPRYRVAWYPGGASEKVTIGRSRGSVCSTVRPWAAHGLDK